VEGARLLDNSQILRVIFRYNFSAVDGKKKIEYLYGQKLRVD